MFRYLLAITLLLTGGMAKLFAQTPPSVDSELVDSIYAPNLETVTIAAASKADSRSPFAFQNLTSRDLKSISKGQEPALLLQQTPSITAYSDAGHSNGYAYFRLRGIDQTRINMTLDGVPLNDPEDQGFYFSNFPDFLNSIGNLQIQRGVGMSKNGAASYGGSLQFESTSLSDSLSINIGIDGGSFYTYRIFGEIHTGTKRNIGAYIRLSQQHSDGYKFHSANTGQSMFGRLQWAKDRHALHLNVLVGHQINSGLAWLGVTKEAIAIDRRSNGNSPQEVDDFMQSLAQLQYRYYINRHLTLRSSAYGIFSKGNYNFDFNNFIGLPSTDELYNYDFLSKMIGGFAHINYEKNKSTIVAGIHGNRYSRRHIGRERTIGKLYENTGYKNEWSAFAKYSYRNEKWLLHTDLQYRHASFVYDGMAEIPTLNWNFFNPKAGVSYQLTKNSTAYYSLGMTGREPTRNDMFGGNDDLPIDSLGTAQLGSTKPEYVTDHELGLRLNRRNLQLNINGYFMQFRDEIILNGQFGPNGLPLTNRVKGSFRAGLEWDSRLNLGKNWIITHNMSYNYSQITATDTVEINFSPVLTPAFIFNQTAIYQREKWNAGIDIRYQSSSFIDFSNANRIDAFWTLGLHAAYRLKHWSASIRAYNLLNAAYYSNGYVDYNGVNRYFVQAPTHFMASIQWIL